MTDTDVLVVGAGPTGLAHALWLARAGVRVRIIDKVAEPGTTSRAVGVAARTLELYRQLGIADEVVGEGWRTPAANWWVRGKHAGRVELASLGEGLSPYPFELMYPQGAHERLLIRALAAAGVQVDRPRALVELTQDEDRVYARLDDGSTCSATYVAGCDGAHSSVRAALGIGLPGATYSHLFFVADVDGTGPVLNGELHIALDTSQFLAAFPLAVGRARVIGTTTDVTKTWDDVAQDVTQRLELANVHVRDFSCYHVHHRVADHFRARRVFLLGDAAHLHSPAGAQGMNTGIGDAINLAWKLADVLHGAPATLLDSYEPERRGFANKLVMTTDRIFQLATKEGGIAEFIRTRIAPHAIHVLLGMQLTRRTGFRLVAQLEISYRESAVSDGFAGDLHAGDRLPWVPNPTGSDNFEPLATREWQLHVYGAASDALRAAGLPVHVFPFSDAAKAAGLARDAVYLIRPDGYIGWADADGDVASLARYRLRYMRT
jgi:2-polyprenyl-6-methoxyphenol hydroxylase-like FAD-dependent oxidoreductase